MVQQEVIDDRELDHIDDEIERIERSEKDHVIEDIEGFGHDGYGPRPRGDLDGEDVLDITAAVVDAGERTVEKINESVNNILGYDGRRAITHLETTRCLTADERIDYSLDNLDEYAEPNEDIKRTRARIERDYTGEDLESYLEDQFAGKL